LHDRVREEIYLEKRVQDLFYEGPAHCYEESLFPRFRWISVVSVTSPDEVLAKSLDRYPMKNRLRATFATIGIPVIVIEDHSMTCVTFTNQLTAPLMEPIVQSLTETIQDFLPKGSRIGIGGVSSRLSDIQRLYRSSIAEILPLQSTGDINPSFEDVHRLVRSALCHIQQEFANVDFSLSLLADRLQVNSSYLSSLFKSETTQTFTQLIAHMRVEEAKRMLAETNLKVYQICERVGYIDHAYFSSLFRTKVGISPYEYRERARHEVFSRELPGNSANTPERDGRALSKNDTKT
jgi:AraC-like DNA-binding protein